MGPHKVGIVKSNGLSPLKPGSMNIKGKSQPKIKLKKKKQILKRKSLPLA